MKLSQRELLEEFLVKGTNVCLTAPHGSGKTTLARKLCQESEILFIDLLFHPSFDSFENYLIEVCRDKSCGVTKHNYPRKIQEIFRRIIIDEAGILTTYQTKKHWGILRAIGGIPGVAILYLSAKTPEPAKDDYCSPWNNNILFEGYTMEEFRRSYPV